VVYIIENNEINQINDDKKNLLMDLMDQKSDLFVEEQ
jgi:hypothetical protein